MLLRRECGEENEPDALAKIVGLQGQVEFELLVGYQCFSTQGDLALQWTFGNVCRHFWLSHSGDGRNCYQWKEARDVAKHPQCIPSSRTKNYQAQILDTAEVEKPWVRQRTFRAGVILCVSMNKTKR